MKFKYYNMLLGVLLLASCNKDVVPNLQAPTFDVTTTTSTFKVGQPITFLFTGIANTISFYSGETLKDYAFKSGRIIDVTGGGATVEFTSSLQVGTQTNQLFIMASSDFNGDYSSVAKIKAATWTDITSRFTLGTSATFVASGTKDISDLIVSGKPIYIAFKYVTTSQATNGLARQWFIQTFAIKSKKTLTNTASATPIALTLADQIHAGFQIVDGSPTTNPAISSVTSTRVTLWGPTYRWAGLAIYDPTLPQWNPKDPMYDRSSSAYIASAVYKPFVPFNPNATDNDPVSETWAVSAPITINSVDLGPDYSTPIKSGPAASTLSSFPYTYTLAGTYKAVFVGFNASMEQTKTVVKEMTLTITP